jgi:hypothetical protein
LHYPYWGLIVQVSNIVSQKITYHNSNNKVRKKKLGAL